MRSIEKGDNSKSGSISDKIDAAVDEFYRYWSARNENMERLRR
jgi:hypothetical protein